MLFAFGESVRVRSDRRHRCWRSRPRIRCWRPRTGIGGQAFPGLPLNWQSPHPARQRSPNSCCTRQNCLPRRTWHGPAGFAAWLNASSRTPQPTRPAHAVPCRLDTASRIRRGCLAWQVRSCPETTTGDGPCCYENVASFHVWKYHSLSSVPTSLTILSAVCAVVSTRWPQCRQDLYRNVAD